MAIDGRLALGAARRGRQRQRQGRVLPHRHRRDRARQGPQVVATEVPFDKRARHQQPRRARRGGGHLAEAQAARDDARGRHDDRARKPLFLLTIPRSAQDTLIEPNVFFAPGVKIAGNARIRAFSHLEGASIGADAEVGPFARLQARRGSRRKGQGRQFLRGQEGEDRRRRQGQPPHLHRRRGDRRQGQYRRRHHHLQL